MHLTASATIYLINTKPQTEHTHWKTEKSFQELEIERQLAYALQITIHKTICFPFAIKHAYSQSYIQTPLYTILIS